MSLTTEEKHARQLQQMKDWRKRNKLHVYEYQAKWFSQNKEKKRLAQRKWSKTEAGRKASRIKCWKKNGILHKDYNKLYEKYLNATECENCSIPLTFGWDGDARSTIVMKLDILGISFAECVIRFAGINYWGYAPVKPHYSSLQLSY
jgi:hypothetical protein